MEILFQNVNLLVFLVQNYIKSIIWKEKEVWFFINVTNWSINIVKNNAYSNITNKFYKCIQYKSFLK